MVIPFVVNCLFSYDLQLIKHFEYIKKDLVHIVKYVTIVKLKPKLNPF